MAVGIGAKHSLELLESLPAGIIHLNAEREVLAMNDYARAVLPIDVKQPFGKLVSAFHKARSRSKVDSLLDETAACPMSQQTSLTMMIDIPDRMLLIKLSQLKNEAHAPTGYALIFFDVTRYVTDKQLDGETPRDANPFQLNHLPTLVDRGVRFVSVSAITCLESNAHATRVFTADGVRMCNLSIGDLHEKLDPRQFLRVHRRYIVNLAHVTGLARVGSRTHLMLAGPDSPEVPVSRDSLPALKQALRIATRG